MSRLFHDSNIQTYAAGRDHPLKETCKEVLRLAARYSRSFFTDAEVLQEMLHRYLALRRYAPAGILEFTFDEPSKASYHEHRVHYVGSGKARRKNNSKFQVPNS